MVEFRTAFDVIIFLNERFGNCDLKYRGEVVSICIHGTDVLGEGPTFEDAATLVANKIISGEIKI